MKALAKLTLACVLASASFACSDSDDQDTRVKPVADGSVANPDGSRPPGTTPDAGGSDAATTLPDGGTPSLTLVDYVNDLINNHTTDDAVPDDVASRTIVDDMNPNAFDSRFQ